jgi:hypothetical protein
VIAIALIVLTAAAPGADAPGVDRANVGRQTSQAPGAPSQPDSPREPSIVANPPVVRIPILPSLDELLGLEPEAGGPARPDGPIILPDDPDREALDRQLTQGEMTQTLEQAVDLMGQTAERIAASRDVGITTQRLQEDILARLDAVITAAEQQQNSGSSSSSSSSSEQQQQQQQASQPGQQSQGEPPGGRDGALAPPVAPDGGVWGRLPPRLRDSLVQGSSDTFSSLYRRLTELYYQRLAEEERR